MKITFLLINGIIWGDFFINHRIMSAIVGMLGIVGLWFVENRELKSRLEQ